MTLSIAELKRKRSTLKRDRKPIIAEMSAILAKDSQEDGDSERFTALEKQVAEHDDQIAEHDDKIEKLEAFHQLSAKNAEEPEDEDDADKAFTADITKMTRSNVVIRSKRAANEPKGTRFARFVMSQGIARKSGSQLAGARYIQDNFGDDEVFKAAMNTTTQALGGGLIPQDFRNEVIELLYAQTVVRGGGATVYPMPMGNLTIPRLRAGATATWLSSELDDLTVTNQGIDDLQFVAKKLGAFVPVSSDLIRRSPSSVEALVRNDLIQQMALAEDLAFLTSDGTSNRPTGMLTLAGFSHTNTTSFSLAVALAELQLNELNLRSANVPMNSVRWLMNPVVRAGLSTLTDSTGRAYFKDELDRGTLNGFPYSMTNQIPTNISSTHTYLILAAMDQCIIADTMAMYADSSDVASYVDGGSTVSAFTRDQVVFRVISEVDFGVRHAKAISYSEVAAWSPSGYTPVAGAAYSTETANTADSAAGSAVTV